MSAADNTSNFSNNSSADVYEDELLTWLQYPVDDAFERNYCSDAFGPVLPLPNAVVAKTGHSDAHPRAGCLSDVRLETCRGSGSSRSLPTKANMGGPKSFLSPSSNAENALALGAARAAGHSSPVGHDAFTKVRTSMQPQAIQTTACASFKALDHKDCSVLNIPVPINASKQAQGGVERPLLRLHIPNSFSSMGKSENAPSGSTSLAMEKSGKVRETHSQQLTHTQQSRVKHVTEEESRGRLFGNHAISRRSAKVKEATVTSSNSFNSRVKAGWSDQASETLPSYSGGSQTSMSLSFMEASYSGKRTHEVLDLQSEDADDKKRGAKVPCNSSSKRNRISHVHNLSERNRRNKINEKLKALQDLIPNSNKTDKASVLDEAIEYMKTLQLQLQMVSTRSSMNMNMMPMAFPSIPMHMAPYHSVGLGVPIGPVGLGVGSGLGVNMQLGLLPQNGGTSPFQPVPSAITQYGMLLEHGNTAHFHDSSQVFMNSGLLPTPLSASIQPSEYKHSRSLSSPHVHHCQQQEQGEKLDYSFLDHHESEQQDGLSD